MLDSLPSPSSVGIISDKSARVCRASKAEATSTKDQAYIKLKLLIKQHILLNFMPQDQINIQEENNYSLRSEMSSLSRAGRMM